MASAGMDVRDIVADWLEEHGYDGLAGEECGCSLDDLMPCADITFPTDCVPGHCDCAEEDDFPVEVRGDAVYIDWRGLVLAYADARTDEEIRAATHSLYSAAEEWRSHEDHKEGAEAMGNGAKEKHLE